jgi:hypothetical protein
MSSFRRLPTSLLALGLLAAVLAGCARPEGPQAPRLLTPAEIAAVAQAAEAGPPDDGLEDRAAALRARAAGLRAGRGAGGDALRRRAAVLTGG